MDASVSPPRMTAVTEKPSLLKASYGYCLDWAYRMHSLSEEVEHRVDDTTDVA